MVEEILLGDEALWQNFGSDEDVRRRLLSDLAAGEIAIPAAGLNFKISGESPLILRKYPQGDFLVPQRFCRLLDFFGEPQTFGPADTQEAALAALAEKRNLLLTGGPGTGKSHVITTFLQNLSAQKLPRPLRVAITAPTGKAAARFSHIAATENVLPQTMTVHRFLGLSGSGGPRFKRGNPAAVDILIVDEVSMVTLSLFTDLIAALPDHARLCLAGDMRQLPAVDGMPVEPLLRFLRENKLIAPVHLTQARRFPAARVQVYDTLAVDGLAALPAEADGLRRRRFAHNHEFQDFLETYAREVFLGGTAERLFGSLTAETNPENIPHEILADAFRFLGQSIVLAAHREGVYGSVETGNRIAAVVAGTRKNRTLTPVIATSNNYTLEIFNGDTGFLLELKDRTCAVFASGEGNFRFIDLPYFTGFETAYAITIHKSQGSEYENVFVVVHGEKVQKDHRLLYTAATRARTLCTMLEV